MSDDARQIRVIMDYLEEYLPEPQPVWPKIEFLRVSYSRWATSRIIKMLYDNPLSTPIRVIEEFKYDINSMMHNHADHPEADIHLEYAYQVACDLEDIIMAMMPY